jgi:hypothetical protein
MPMGLLTGKLRFHHVLVLWTAHAVTCTSSFPGISSFFAVTYELLSQISERSSSIVSLSRSLRI